MPSYLNRGAVAAAAATKLVDRVVRSARTGSATLTAADNGKLIDVTSGTFTQTIDSASNVGDGWSVYYKNSGTGVITITAGIIGGASSATVNPGNLWLITCDGTSFHLLRLEGDNTVLFSSGTGTFVVPAGVYQIYAEAWGGGASPGALSGSSPGGGGGAYCAALINVTPGQSISYVIGAGGGSGQSGGTTTFGNLSAGGGSVQGAGGTATGGDINIRGGVGACNSGGGFMTTQIAGNGALGGSGGSYNQGFGNPQNDGGFPGGGAVGTNTAGSGALRITWV